MRDKRGSQQVITPVEGGEWSDLKVSEIAGLKIAVTKGTEATSETTVTITGITLQKELDK
jgi:hypothetical protein